MQETEHGFLVDKEQLQRALEPKNCEVTDEALELRWVGKKEAYHSGYSLTDKIIQPLKEQSKDFENTGNVLIKGDNLDALKLLQKNYFERIKMIYIDPPYNTQNDNFIYRDNFTKTQEEVLDELGYDKEQKEYIKNIAGAQTHSGWLSFIYPRLLLARELLRDDGVIFISIDDNEQANLKLLCDEVFGEMNFVANFSWVKTATPPSLSKTLRKKSRIICPFYIQIKNVLNVLYVGFGLENTPSRFRFFNSFPASSLVPTFPFCLFTKLAGFKILLFFLIYLIEKITFNYQSCPF